MAFHTAVARRDFALLCLYRGSFKAAASHLNKAQAIFEKQGTENYISVASAYKVMLALSIGNSDAALEAAQVARKLADVRKYEIDIIRAEWLLGAALMEQAKKAVDSHDLIIKAQSHLYEAYTRCQRCYLIDLEPEILLSLANVQHLQGKLVQARVTAKEALAIADRCEYRLVQADIYNFLGRLAFDEHNFVEARTHTEMAKERAWCDGPPYYYKPAIDQAERLLQDISRR